MKKQIRNRSSQKLRPKIKIARAPAASATTIRAAGPQITRGSAPRGSSIVIRHSEYFSTVTGTDPFAVTGLPLNPGIASIFPWLSPIAHCYETYQFRRLRFIYHPRCPSITAGMAGAVFDFDCNDPAPGTSIEALSYQDKVSSNVWTGMELDVGFRNPKERFTRAGTPVGDFDLRLYDLGNFYFFTEGCPTSVLGQWEVSYEVELFTPQYQDTNAGVLTWQGDPFFPLDQPFAGRVVSPPHTRVPFETPRGGSLVKFIEPFQGLLACRVHSGNLSFAYDDHIHCFSDPSGRPCDRPPVLATSFIADLDMLYTFAVSCLAGTVLQFVVNSSRATILTWTSLMVSRGAYDQFTGPSVPGILSVTCTTANDDSDASAKSASVSPASTAPAKKPSRP